MKSSGKKIVSMIVMVLMVGMVVSESRGGNRSGTVAGQFLKISTSARAMGMGGAQVAIAEGASSLAFYPAGMMSVSNYGVGLTYTKWFADIQHSYMGMVKNIPDVGAVGVSVTMLTTDDMKETTPDHPEGTGRNFKASDYAFGLAFGRQVTDQFRVGVSGKVIKSYLFNADLGSSSFAFDIGTLYNIPILRSRIGVSITNIGKDLKYINETYSIPTALRFGVLVDVLKEANQQFVTTLQITRLNDADEQYNIGTEYVLNDQFALRGGWKFAYDQENVTFGFGAKINTFGFDGKVDYAFNNFRYLPATHSFTFEIQF